MKQDSFLRTGLPDTPRDKPCRTDHIVFQVRLLNHIFSKVHLLLDHRMYLGCSSVRTSGCFLEIDSEVLQTHRRPRGM
jgi:hypothetical protein